MAEYAKREGTTWTLSQERRMWAIEQIDHLLDLLNIHIGWADLAQ